jgi:hypothetical protein
MLYTSQDASTYDTSGDKIIIVTITKLVLWQDCKGWHQMGEDGNKGWPSGPSLHMLDNFTWRVSFDQAATNVQNSHDGPWFPISKRCWLEDSQMFLLWHSIVRDLGATGSMAVRDPGGLIQFFGDNGAEAKPDSDGQNGVWHLGVIFRAPITLTAHCHSTQTPDPLWQLLYQPCVWPGLEGVHQTFQNHLVSSVQVLVMHGKQQALACTIGVESPTVTPAEHRMVPFEVHRHYCSQLIRMPFT